MPYKEESMLMGKDAPANTSTELCFNPPQGPFDASNVVKGNIMHAGDEDWIAIKLTEGNTYTITVGGDTTGTTDAPKLNDSILKLMDSKGGLIAMNDDKNGAKGMLGSEVMFTPEEGSGEQVYYISVSGYGDNPGALNTGAYTVEVTETMLTPGAGIDIEGTDAPEKLTGMDKADRIEGMGGDDVLDGRGGDDMLDGGGDNDLLIGGAGADDIKGGAGEDTVSYETSPDGVNVNLRTGKANGGDAEGDELGTDIENIIGSMYDDELDGDRDGNKLWGLGGDDDLDGDDRKDELYGGMGDDELDGGGGDDLLIGGPGADELTGGGGEDTASWAGSMMGVTVRLHSHQAMGGDAEGDTWGKTTTVPYTLKDADGKDVEHEETVPDIIHLTGSGMADVLAGDSRINRIEGGGGDDHLYGGPGGGDDILHGDGGHDPLFGGHDKLYGGLGDDELYGGAGNDTLVGGKGNDTVYGGYGSDMIYADSADTTLINGWLLPYDATDTDNPLRGPANVPAGSGITDFVNESLEIGSDPGAVDTVSYEKLKAGVTAVLSSDPATGTIRNVENLIGTNEDDTLTGSTGNNVIDGLDGADMLDGLAGNDTVSYSKSDRGVTVTVNNAGDGTASGGHAQGDKISNFENATGSAYSDTLFGDATANVLKGLAGDDELEGNAGGDTLVGGAGRDELNGGTNATDLRDAADGADRDGDTVSYEGSDAAVTVNLATLSFSGGHAEGDEDDGAQRAKYDHDGDDETDELDVSSFERVIGSDHNDHLTGDHRDNRLTGGAGDDTLRGGASSTAVDGIAEVTALNRPNGFSIDRRDEGDNLNERNNRFIINDGTGDILHGGPGADYLDGGEDANEKDNMVPNPNFDDTQDPSDTNPEMVAASMDIASYRGAMAGVTVNLATGRGEAGDAMGDTLVNIEQVWGSDHDDTFIAGPGPDNITGGAHVRAGSGPGGDTVSYALSPVGVTVNLNAAAQTDSDPDSYAKDDVLYGIEHVIGSDYDDELTSTNNGSGPSSVLEGKGGDDTLNGGNRIDILMGGDGDDTINAGSGADEIFGGAGDDTINAGGGFSEVTGGPGSDDMDGGGAIGTQSGTNSIAIFIFSPEEDDVNDVDLIQNFNTTRNNQSRGERIDLRAYGFEKDGSDLVPLISLRGDPEQADSELIIDLRSKGGGIIILNGVNDLDLLEVERGSGDFDNDVIDTLDIWDDKNFVTDIDGSLNEELNLTNDDGIISGNENGIFIL